MKLAQKDEELRFLQEELTRMRAEQGDRQLERASGGTTSLQMVDTLWNQNKETEAETQRRQIRELQARVESLEANNENLTNQLKIQLDQAPLKINEDDHE